MYIYNKDNGQSRIVKPDNFKEKGDWNFMCFYQWHYRTMFVAYLGEQYEFYEFNFQEETFKTSKLINHGIHAFKWKTDGYNYERDPYKQMFTITQYDGYYFLNNYLVNVRDGNLEFKEYNYTALTLLKSKYIASFSKDTFNFNWMSYNNVSDFESGGHSNNEVIGTANFTKTKIDKFTNSPLVFFEKMEIVELKFIFAMHFAYYKLKDDKEKFYYGIIDAQTNRVIFHTDEKIVKYLPYSNYAMLAITEKSAYKICVSRNETDCVICNNNQFMLDSSKYNFCGTKCNTKYTIIPYNICTDTCDERIYSIKDNKCGICKDFGDDNKYKFYNQPGCIKEKPENTIYINEDLKIIDCDNNYKYENGKCVLKCYDNCDKCSAYSTDINNQYCTSCKNGFFLQKANCVEKCSNGYFVNDKYCQECDNSCETCDKASNNCTSCKNGQLFLQDGNCVEKCSKNYFLIDKNCQKCDLSCETCDKTSNNCTSCINGKYIDKNSEIHICKDCTNNCETCKFRGDNCITCNQDSSFKYFFNFSCYEYCPNNTKLDEALNICEEIKNEDKKKSKSDSAMLSIFTIITAGLLFLTLFCFFRRYCCLNKKTPDNLLNEINTELREN